MVYVATHPPSGRLMNFSYGTEEHAIQERIAEMRATWQDPTAAWEESTQSSTTNAQVEMPLESAIPSDPSIVRCIALYPYIVSADNDNVVGALYSLCWSTERHRPRMLMSCP